MNQWSKNICGPLTFNPQQVPNLQECVFQYSSCEFFVEPAPSLPFQIKRSKTNNLPVYVDKKRGGSLVLTVIRNIKGDLNVRFRNILLVISEMEAEKLVVFASAHLKYLCSISLYWIISKIIIS